MLKHVRQVIGIVVLTAKIYPRGLWNDTKIVFIIWWYLFQKLAPIVRRYF